MFKRIFVLVLLCVFSATMPAFAEIKRYFQSNPYVALLVSTTNIPFEKQDSQEKVVTENLVVNFSYWYALSGPQNHMLIIGRKPNTKDEAYNDLVLSGDNMPQFVAYKGETPMPIAFKYAIRREKDLDKIMVQFLLHREQRKPLYEADRLVISIPRLDGSRTEFEIPAATIKEWQYIMKSEKSREYRQARREDKSNRKYTEAEVMERMLYTMP